MGDFQEQHVSVKFCFKLWKTFSEAFEILNQAFWGEAMNRTQTHEWNKRFKEGRASVEASEGSGRHSA
jgi:hypothetical protein